MGRWTRQDATVCIFGTVNCAFGENTSDARRIVDAHNADCDAYEKRIAELEAKQGRLRQIILDDGMELARVKAESLRVVESGPVCELQDCITEYCFIEGKNRLNVASEFAKRNYPTIRVQPLTLERWETEE